MPINQFQDCNPNSNSPSNDTIDTHYTLAGFQADLKEFQQDLWGCHLYHMIGLMVHQSPIMGASAGLQNASLSQYKNQLLGDDNF